MATSCVMECVDTPPSPPPPKKKIRITSLKKGHSSTSSTSAFT